MTADLSAIAPRLAKLVLLLGSDQPGEVVSAANAIGRTLEGVGANWHDLAARLIAAPESACPSSPPASRDHLAMAERLWNGAPLSPWEREFVGSLLARLKRRNLTAKQTATLAKIHAQRFGGAQ